jgi:hypothetical protein
MKAKRPAPVRDGDERRRRARQPGRGANRRSSDAPPHRRRPTPEQRPQRSAPQTSPIPRPVAKPARPKNTSQAKARAKARKAKAPKVIRPPLRQRLILKLASIELNPRRLVNRVPFVVLVIGSLGLGLGVTLWLSTDAAQRSYQLSHARETNQGLLQQKEALERDVLEAQAAPALAEAARNLGMIPSKDTAHLVQDPAGNWVVVGTPKPAEGVPPPPLNRPVPDSTQAPPPPPPPAPRVVDPRELPVRVPVPGAAVPNASGVEVPHAVGGPVAQPPALAPADPLAGQPPAAPPAGALPLPPAPVASAPLADSIPAPAAPLADHLVPPAAPAPATPAAPGGDQVAPVAAPVPGPPA